MRAGSLRQRIDIGNFSTVSDGAGGSIPTFRVDKTVWGDIRPVSGGRDLEGNKINIEQLFDIRIRFDDYPILSKRNHLAYEGRTFVIHSIIIVNERKKEFKIKAYDDGGNNVFLYNENYEIITDQDNEYITV